MKRKIIQQLKLWKDNPARKPLILLGARQVGKTWVMKHFGLTEFENVAYINCDVEPLAKELFAADYNIPRILLTLQAITGTKIEAGKTLIVFDELQEVERGLHSLKYFQENAPEYHVMAAGSLLGITLGKGQSFPVGKVNVMHLYPMDFEEFLWALYDEVTVPFIRQAFEAQKPLGQAVHRKVMNSFRQYLLVGGMPQSVLAYLNGKDFAASDMAKRNILRLYRDDVAKFAEGYEDKVYAVFDGIPGQLSKKEKKYRLSSLGENARFRSYEDSFIWLNEAMVVNTCFNATDPNVGLALSADHATQKCYMADTGLLVTQTFMDKGYTDNELYKAILFDKLDVNEGMILENMVAQMLRCRGHKLYFYSRCDKEHRENHMEVDFLIAEGKKIAPIEVKSGSYRSHASLDKFRAKFSSKIGESYILYTKDVMRSDNILHLPIYMAMFL